jgi:ABC-type branched-subunit amino acid transport system permease subunit/ABC-type branched-subunit amino acid transport system ATPase component
VRGPTTPLAVLAVQLPMQVTFSGIVTGLTYGMTAVGVLLVYRMARFVNFAVIALGGLAAAVLARLVINNGMSWLVAFVLCVLLGGALGAVTELTVVRRLFDAPRIILLVATIGVAQVLGFVQLMLPKLQYVRAFPAAVEGRWQVGDVIVHGDELVALVVLPAVTLGLTLFLRLTRQGSAIRAAAANPDAAQLAGINVRRMSTLVWVLAGMLSAISVILAAPLTTSSADQLSSLGPSLLLRVLTAAVIGRMSSMVGALAGGIAIGVTESVLFYNLPDQRGVLDAALLVVVLLALLTLTGGAKGAGGSGPWALAPRVRATLLGADTSPWIRRLSCTGWGVAALLALGPLLVLTQASQQFFFSRMLVYLLVAVSLTVLTGWAGQVSLGQFAFVGIGAMATAALVNQGLGFFPALGLAAAVGALGAVVVGAPALRMPGLFLAVSTLAFAVATTSWILGLPLFGADQGGATLKRPVIGPVSLRSQGAYYVVCLVSVAIVLVAVNRLRNSGFGRSLIAVRDNEQAAASMGVSPTRTKLTAFAIGGAIAGFAGGLMAGLLVTFEPARFAAGESLQVVAIAVIGGLGSIAGAVLGTLWVVGLPALFADSTPVTLLTSGAGLLVLLLYFPRGLIQVPYRARDALVARLDAAVGSLPRQPDAPGATRTATVARPVASTVDDAGHSLGVRGLTVRYGPRVVVDDVDLVVGPGEVVGLIGANGAGKSTLLHAVGGFVPSTGVVELLGQDVSGWTPARRAAGGLGRSFQGAELFAELTVAETVMVATEARHRSVVVSAILGLPAARRAERVKRAQADEILDLVGLGPLSTRFISEVSTGTRRIVELACLVASGARVLCLDEPTAGLAQRETEAYGPLLLRLRDDLQASLLVVEHDMPLVMSLSDRLYCLEAGRVIAEGPPAVVRRDPRVVASYLGTDERAINRSGVPARLLSDRAPAPSAQER